MMTLNDAEQRKSSSLKLPLREVLRHDEDAPFGRTIYLYWNEITHPIWIDFEIFEAIGCEGPPDSLICTRPGGEGRPLYYATDRRAVSGKDSVTTDLNRAMWTVRGFVKFDGCTQVYFPEGPLHYDDKASFRGLFSGICRAQERCYKIMDENCADDETGATSAPGQHPRS